jgi:hypothetical protein
VSGAWRTNEILPATKLDLSGSAWRTVSLVFSGQMVKVSIDGDAWSETLSRPGFCGSKRKLLWMQNAGRHSLEIDEITVFEPRSS